MRIQDQGVVLRRTPFQENSLVVHLLSRHHGLISGVVRGVRKSGRRGDGRRGALAGFHTIDLEWSARSATAMGTLTRIEIVTARQHLPASAARLAAAQLLLEVAYRFSAQGDDLSEMMALLECALDLLEDEAPPLDLLASVLGLFTHLIGYGWRTDACAGCQRREKLSFFSVRRGQVVCQPCGEPYVHRLVPLSEKLLAKMQSMAWPPVLGVLSPNEQALVYRMAISSLIRAGGRVLLADPPFRALMGQELFLQAGYTPITVG